MFHEIKAGDCTIHMDERFIPPKIRSLAASQILQHRSFLLFQHTGVVAGWSSKQFGTSTERVWVVLVVRFPGVGAGGGLVTEQRTHPGTTLRRGRFRPSPRACIPLYTHYTHAAPGPGRTRLHLVWVIRMTLVTTLAGRLGRVRLAG